MVDIMLVVIGIVSHPFAVAPGSAKIRFENFVPPLPDEGWQNFPASYRCKTGLSEAPARLGTIRGYFIRSNIFFRVFSMAGSTGRSVSPQA